MAHDQTGQNLKHLTLESCHIEAGARMQAFAGWLMPMWYRGILAEHRQTREKASVFDCSHMGLLRLSGPDCRADLEKLDTCAVESLKIGRCRYGFLLNESGGVIDDLIIFRRAESEFLAVVNAGTADRDAEWMSGHLSTGSSLENLNRSWGKLDLQGPQSAQVLADLEVRGVDPQRLGYFRFGAGKVLGSEAVISRTGYTGELGFEIFLPKSHIEVVWRRLLRDERVAPAGLGARDVLRLEVGFPLYGHELSHDRTPIESGLDRFVSWGKDFIGKQVLLEQREKGVTDRLVGFVLDGRQAARSGDKILRGGREVGRVTSGAFAPSVGSAVAMGFVGAEAVESEAVFEFETSRARIAGRMAEIPFYREGSARTKIRDAGPK